MYPTEMEKYWCLLSGSEQKLLDFILRRTYGFQKLEDRISLSQFASGGGKIGHGAGISKAQAQRSLKTLEEKGFIRTEAVGYQTRLIKLVLRDEEADEPVREKVAASDQNAYLISLFRNIAGTEHLVDGYMTSKAQIQAMERLLQVYSQDDIERFIVGAKEAHGEQYAPTISSPIELEKNLPKLFAFFKRREANRITVSF